MPYEPFYQGWGWSSIYRGSGLKEVNPCLQQLNTPRYGSGPWCRLEGPPPPPPGALGNLAHTILGRPLPRDRKKSQGMGEEDSSSCNGLGGSSKGQWCQTSRIFILFSVAQPWLAILENGCNPRHRMQREDLKIETTKNSTNFVETNSSGP